MGVKNGAEKRLEVHNFESNVNSIDDMLSDELSLI
jgi:hypothetical protein